MPPGPSATEWESHREELRKLYLVDNISRDHVMSYMRENHGFIATKNQYDRQFKNVWKFRKNLNGTEWKFVQNRIEKRKRDTKESIVYVDGIEFPGEKFNRAKRHCANLANSNAKLSRR
ncbi:hypothetical protein K440DRAFT_646032 [Wilcoxina mikolae CBS 423.85]|nr:hypothetical protein K440DRAFT_646032 [Wilcoxina mikolae CBS 423.85]